MGSQQSDAELRTILVVDVEGFHAAAQSRPDRLALREGLYDALQQGWAAAGVSWEDSYFEDRGDGALVLAPVGTSPEVFVDVVPEAVADALRQHNAIRPFRQHVRLWLALHIGEVAFDGDYGAYGASTTVPFRLADALHQEVPALAGSPSVLAVITSERFFDEVVQHSRVVDPAAFHQVTGIGKETSLVGWVWVVPGGGGAGEMVELPVTIYLADERIHEQVQDAVENLLGFAGAEIVEQDDPVLGSWFRRLRAKAAASPAAREAAASAAHAVEARLVLSQDASITATMLQNLGPVLTALQPTPDAVLRIGALLIVKSDDVVVVHQLTAAQQLTLDHQPHLLTAPEDVLRALDLTTADRLPADGEIAAPAPQISNHGQSQPRPSGS
ncbi:hypothetical protein [Amycolatopsis samaneae]|uniref:Uncharacterized protein n=1 Tax=Amycolatopsis samaneae TaxID=664691 RepID=A0ABW5GXB5_9PSEU